MSTFSYRLLGRSTDKTIVTRHKIFQTLSLVVPTDKQTEILCLKTISD